MPERMNFLFTVHWLLTGVLRGGKRGVWGRKIRCKKEFANNAMEERKTRSFCLFPVKTVGSFKLQAGKCGKKLWLRPMLPGSLANVISAGNVS